MLMRAVLHDCAAIVMLLDTDILGNAAVISRVLPSDI